MQQGFFLHEAGVTFWRSRKSYTFFTPKTLSITGGFEPISTATTGRSTLTRCEAIGRLALARVKNAPFRSVCGVLG